MATSTLFDSIDTDFRRLRNLGINGKKIHAGLPQRPIALSELKSVLLHPSTPFSARDGAFNELITRSRRGDSRWTTAILGVLLPGIRRSAGKLGSGGCILATEEIEAEMIGGVINEIATMNLSRGHVPSRLTWAGYRAALKACHSAAVAPPPSHKPSPCQSERQPWGHPELVLAEAAECDVITAAESNLIGATRLDGVTFARLAHESGELMDTIKRRRWRAEQRLIAWLRETNQP